MQTIHGVKKIINMVPQNKMNASSSIHVQLVVMVGNHLQLMDQGVKNTNFVITITNKIGTLLIALNSILVSKKERDSKLLKLITQHVVSNMTSVQTTIRKTGT